MSINIGNRIVGSGQKVLVIAEIGVNHDGSVARALELVQCAAAAGADAVKLQIFQADKLMHASSSFAAYQKRQCDDKCPAAMLRRFEFSPEEIRQVVDAILAKGMIPLATPFSPTDVTIIAELNLPAVKIASPDLVNYPLLRRAAALGKPLLLSTGAASMPEITTTAQWLTVWGAAFALLHCVSSYPTPDDQANLAWIGELSRRFGVPVGFSDHTNNLLTGAIAVAAGASVIEKHLTYDRAASGPDHAASADPGEFATYVSNIHQAQVLRGGGTRQVLAVEADVRQVSRQSLVLTRDLSAGAVIGDDDLTVQRPGTGISAGQYPLVVGRRTAIALAAGTMLQWPMLG